MRRCLLLALVLALAAAVPALAHEGSHEANGTISALSYESITVSGGVVPPTAAGDVMTCAIVAGRSPSVAGFKLGDKVYAKCDYLDAKTTLTVIRSAVPAVKKWFGSIARLSRTSITVKTSSGRVTCSVPSSKRAKLKGMKVGHKVVLSCRKLSGKWVLVNLVGHAGH